MDLSAGTTLGPYEIVEALGAGGMGKVAIGGDYAAVMVNDPVTSTDLWLLNLNHQYDMRPFKQTTAAERQGTLSPDGRWMAYASNESRPLRDLRGAGAWSRRPLANLHRRRRAAALGAKWSRDHLPQRYQGDECIGASAAGFPGRQTGYDVTPDGQTFVMTRSEQANPTEIRVVVGWSLDQALKK